MPLGHVGAATVGAALATPAFAAVALGAGFALARALAVSAAAELALAEEPLFSRAP